MVHGGTRARSPSRQALGRPVATMRSWFSRSSPAQDPAARAGDQDVGTILGQAQDALNRLRLQVAPDWPLLNQATRLVQQVDGAVMRMSSDDDMKGVWRRWGRQGRGAAPRQPPAAPRIAANRPRSLPLLALPLAVT